MELYFHGKNKIIEVHGEETENVITIDVQRDIYSAWKQWVKTNNNAKYLPSLKTIGGEPTVGVKVVSPYFFLLNGWKFKPYTEHHHVINLVGNLFVDNPETYGSNVFAPPDGAYTVLINMSTTSDATVLLAGSGVTTQDKQDIANLAKRKIAPLLFAK